MVAAVMFSRRLSQSSKGLVLLLGLMPFCLLVWDSVTGGLSVNPVEDITHRTRDCELQFIIVALAAVYYTHLKLTTILLV